MTGPAGADRAQSRLWGAAGEVWDPAGPLGDFSFAGCGCGERPLPQPPVAADVRAFGARGDGRADDGAAFQRAIAATVAGAVLVPAGRYRIRDRLLLDRPGLVLRGEGPARSILLFDRTLSDVEPHWGATTTGQRTSHYSWSGGFVCIRGDLGLRPGAAITAPARRGERSLQVEERRGLAPGQWLGVEVQDDTARSLCAYLYGGDHGPVDQLPPLRSWQAARVLGLETATGRLTLDRPLRLDLRPAWRPRLLDLAPSVSGCGIEGLGFQFPDTPWMGEFTELGYNAIALEGAAHCWVRDVAIHNAEGGVFVDGLHCTLQDLVLTASKPAGTAETYGSPLGCRGHHGIAVHGGDHLISGFDLRTRYVHDLTVDGPTTAGNVFSRGRGSDLCLDHHKKAAHANLFSDLDFGVGGRPWRSGGGAGLGRACGAWETFWGLSAQRDMDPPPPGWAGGGLVLVGGDFSPGAEAGGWHEALSPGRLEPPDLHAAQVARRLGA